MKMSVHFLVVFLIFSLASTLLAHDPAALKDFCVADKNTGIFLNGYPCKNPAKVTIRDFLYKGIDVPANTANYLNSKVTLVDVDTLPGLNTLDISLGRVDFGPHGLNPPHLHNRASELFVVLEGTLYAGFITNNPDHKLYATVIKKGDAICFPIGLIHFQLNLGSTNAVAFAMLSGQNPGVQHIGQALFNSTPLVDYPNVLTSSFQIDKATVRQIMGRFKTAVSD